MNKLLAELGGGSEKFTKAPKKQKKFNKVKDNIPLAEDYNFEADLLFLPTAKFGYKYLLIIVDLATDEFDIEPLKNKTADGVLKATKKIFERQYLNIPYASIRTDPGTEFKGEFDQFFKKHNVMHKFSLKDRHKQMANAESLNKQLGLLINAYLNAVDEKRGKTSKDWLNVIPKIRDELNKIRKKDLHLSEDKSARDDNRLPKDWKTHNYAVWNPFDKKPGKEITKIKSFDDIDFNDIKGKKEKMAQPKFKVGDMVHRALDRPENAFGEKQHGGFRVGDYRWEKKPREIKQVVLYAGHVKYRYLLDGIKNASYSELELMKA